MNCICILAISRIVTKDARVLDQPVSYSVIYDSLRASSTGVRCIHNDILDSAFLERGGGSVHTVYTHVVCEY